MLIEGKLDCYCIVGWAVGDLCTSIVGCIQPIDYSDKSKGCLACDPGDFFPRPVNKACQCRQGVLAGRKCISIPGCVTALTDVHGEPHCVFCNTTAGFKGLPNSGVCECLPHTALLNNICKDICGDGFLATDLYSCDDGNLISGDGCSSSCSV